MGKTRRHDNGGVKRLKGSKRKRRKAFHEFQEEEPTEVAYKNLDHVEEAFYKDFEDDDGTDQYYK
tara:strand:+ start:156 stop:350 length:195 start_codon:yes stop_codon:yes gene_type:complete